MLNPNQQKRVLLCMGHRYMARIHQGVAQFAGKNRWHLTNLFGTDPDLIHQRDCDGIIAILDKDDPLSSAIIQRHKPTVDVSLIRQDLKMPHLTGNNFAMGRDAAHHFIERGFRNFFWFSERNHPPAQLRQNGFQSTLKAAGFDCTPLIVEEKFQNHRPTWNALSRWIQNEIRPLGLPCAVYAYNDNQAVNLIDACVSGNIRIPEEVAVLGSDNNPLICPTAAVPLSSINHDLEELGRRAAEELDRIMNGAPMKRKIIEIPHRGITVRQSSDIFAINDRLVVRALRFIHTNFDRNIGVGEIVQETGISRRSLEQHFQKHMECSILRKLTHLRLENACRLLRESTLSIADIAALSGFNTPEYLHRVFLKQIGTTPRKYRLTTAD
jgi:LacI family transcriptional regulator